MKWFVAPPAGGPASAGGTRLVALILFLSFAAYGTWTAPVPGINEPHYLGKAKHFWNPEWCARDLFLQSAEAHWFFYATFGGLTRVLSLEQTAWVGRALVWGLLAWGWARLGSVLFSSRWGAVGAIWLLLAWFAAGTISADRQILKWFASGSFSGEWLIGGVEAKGFAYGLLFLALAEASAYHWNRAGACLGLAISFHPLVGGWGAIAGTFAILVRCRRIARELPECNRHVRLVFQPLAVCGLLALPGLIPALGMLAAAPSAEVAELANEIQVLDRLDHHLDPKKFPMQAYAAHGWLLAAWLAARWFVPFARAERFFFPFVLGTVLIAFAGLTVGLGPRWLGVMKYYPFRLFDLFLPLAGATLLVELLSATRARRALGAALSAAALLFAVTQPSVGQNPGGFSKREYWIEFVEACRWIDANTPADAMFLTPRFNFGFKWYAQRAEFASYKDCPQDAANLVEWKRRLDLVSDWRAKHFDAGFDSAAVAELQQATGVDFILAWKSATMDPYAMSPVFRNGSFAVYRPAK